MVEEALHILHNINTGIEEEATMGHIRWIEAQVVAEGLVDLQVEGFQTRA